MKKIRKQKGINEEKGILAGKRPETTTKRKNRGERERHRAQAYVPVINDTYRAPSLLFSFFFLFGLPVGPADDMTNDDEVSHTYLHICT